MSSYSVPNLISSIREKGVRYVGVTVINVIFGQALLFVFSAVLVWPVLLANFLSVTISAIPAYVLSRAWVWGKTGKNHLTKEILPFWGMALIGLACSSLAVKLVESYRAEYPIIVNVASTAAFGVLWVIKFFILDSLMFGAHHHVPEDEALSPAQRTRAD